jgi:hypothetical protein
MPKKELRRAIFYEVSMDDSNPNALRGVEKDTRGIDPSCFYSGRWIDDWPVGITFSYSLGEEPEDYLVAGAYWELASERVRQVFVQYQIAGVQFLPIRALYKKTGKEVGTYWALNVVREVEALDWTHTLWTTSDNRETEKNPALHILRPALLCDQLRDVDIFRLRIRGQGDFSVFVSERLKRYLEAAKATSGIYFIPVSAY